MARHPAVHTSAGKWVAWSVLTVFTAFTLGMVLWLVAARQSDQNDLGGMRSTVNQLSTLAAQNQAQLGKLGERPVGPPAASVSAGKATPPPTDIAPVTPGPTKMIAVGPTAGQVKTAVDAYFADNPVKPPQVTAQQLAPLVTKYVTQYLRDHPPAAGPPGKAGTAGSPGKPGTVGKPGHPGSEGATGEPGAPASNTQIAAAVTAYLPGAVAAYAEAHPAPAGPAGPSGAPGANCDPETTPACIGPSGPAGPPGSPGKDATPEEIATAVADYINSNGVPCPDGTHQGDVPVQGLNPLSPGPTIRGCIIDD